MKAGDTPNVLWRNNGNKTFTEWTEPTGLGGSGKTAAAMLTDFNNDRAVDLRGDRRRACAADLCESARRKVSHAAAL